MTTTIEKPARRHWSQDPEMAARVKAKLTGIKRSEATKAKLRARVITPEWREKLRIASIGQIHSEEHKQKIAAGCRGLPGPNKGKKFSEDQRKRMSIAMKGRIFTKEHCKALSNASKGHAPALYFHKGRSVDYVSRDGATCHLMSSYELAVAEYLDATEEGWTYVGRDILHSFLLNDGRRYYPDFYVKRLGIYIDPKGFDRDPAKRTAVEQQYPGRVRFLIGKTYLEQLKELLNK